MIGNKKFLTAKEAAEYLGFKLSYFRKMMMRRVIPMYKPGGKICLFDPDDLDNFIRSARIPSQADLDEAAAKYLVNRNLKK